MQLVRLFAFMGLAVMLGAVEATAEDGALPAVSAEHHAHIRSQATADLIAAHSSLEDNESPETGVPATAAELVAALDAADVRYALVVSVAYRLGEPGMNLDDEWQQVRAENDYVVRQAQLAPGRLVAACAVNPLKDYATDEVTRCADELGVRVLKLHLANSGVDLHDDAHIERLVAVLGEAGRQGMSALVHLRNGEDFGADDARMFVDDVLRVLPSMHLQIAHMGGWGGYDDATDSALGVFVDAIADGTIDRERIQFDLAAVVFDPDAAGDNKELADFVRAGNSRLAERIRTLGPDRVLFATDWPSWPPTRDQSLKIAQNIRLLHKALPLTDDEWTIIHGNVSPVFSGLDE